MVYRLTRISVWPVVKISFIINGLIGLSFGVFYGLLLMAAGSLLSMAGDDAVVAGLGAFSGVLGFMVALVLGMLYGVFGAGAAAFTAWMYNMLAHLIGGIELTLEAPEAVASVPAPAVPMETVSPPADSASTP